MYPTRTRRALVPALSTRPLIWLPAILLMALFAGQWHATPTAPRMIGMADLDTLSQAYDRWSSARDRTRP
ncbi:MAG: hypothetical protein FJ189_14500, partial [Gammaproteobacteria bacterium]|nr:hypothetical protein [Gammaproteobacteria bacterium]